MGDEYMKFLNWLLLAGFLLGAVIFVMGFLGLLSGGSSALNYWFGGIAVICLTVFFMGLYFERECIADQLGLSQTRRAQANLARDVARRGAKIEKWRTKYGIDLKPIDSLEELTDKLGVHN